MGRTDFIDYYKLLQVHYDASPEVIKAAYLRLTKAYHPDSSGAFSDGISTLNEAFSVLKDPASRTVYHQKWLEHHTKVLSMHDGAVPAGITSDAAKDTLDLFFRYFCIKDWESAYQLLTYADKKKTSYEDFASWRESVALCSEIASYEIRYSRSLYETAVDGIKYSRITEFNVNITEVNALTSETARACVKKLCVYDGMSWRVVLGISNAKALALRFRLTAERGKNIDSMSLYHSAVSRIDMLTGLLSERGFLEECEKESDRTRRYRTPASVIAFKLHSAPERETACLCQLASIIRDGKRRPDIAARLDNDIIICLLPETRKNSGELAAKKFLKLIEKKKNEEFSVSYGVLSFTESLSPAEAVRSVCELAGI
jgi:curved DNA-binding protein CbpA/GGDEF domain-containing protein